MPRNTMADMLDMLETTNSKKLASFEARDPELAAEFWSFFMEVKDRCIEIEAAFDAWEANRGPLPCSRSNLRNVINARHRARK